MAVLTNRDIKEETHTHRWGPWVLDEHVQVTAVHEQSHMLGLPHVGERNHYPQCKKDRNGEICYGWNETDRDELSGMGMHWAPIYDRP